MCAIEFPEIFSLLGAIYFLLRQVTLFTLLFGGGSFDFCLGAVFATLEKQKTSTVFG